MIKILQRSTSRTLGTLALGLFLGLGAFSNSASAQAAKEPTDGFFDVPPREEGENYGVPAYMVTSAFAGLAMFILCKSARRA